MCTLKWTGRESDPLGASFEGTLATVPRPLVGEQPALKHWSPTGSVPAAIAFKR